MVAEVFCPHFWQSNKSPEGSAIFDLAVERRRGSQASNDQLKMCETLPSTTGGGPPYIFCCVLEYMRSLLKFQILPHRVVQMFLFDICVFYGQDYTLQQLIQYHVILDSTDAVKRLYNLWKCTQTTWACQACLDMSLRMKDWGVVVDILVEFKEYLEVIPLLRRRCASNYPLKHFLSRMANDIVAQQNDPELLPHVLSSVRAWMRDAGNCSGRNPPSMVSNPNLRECEIWFPDMTVQNKESESSESI